MKSDFLKSVEPYSLLFTLGLIHGILGGLKWILFLLQLIPYPGLSHAHHMFTGFLLSFAMGFLMTAVPRFTGAPRSSRFELFIAGAISFVSFFVTSSFMPFIALGFLGVFFLSRMSLRKHNPPAHFIFIPMGLVIGFTGAFIGILCEVHVINESFYSYSRLFLFYGTMLSFLLGIGAKLISALLGWAPLPTHQLNAPHLNAVIQFKPALQVMLFAFSFILEAMEYKLLGRTLRAVCASWIAIENWKIYKMPKNPSKFAFWIFVSCWFLVLGLWVHAIAAHLEIHAAHLIFVGGFGCITLMVASRVTLAHGSHSLEKENISRVYAVYAVLIFAAALTRFTAIWTPSYFRHLAYAGGVWVLALLVWSWIFVPKALSKDVEIG